MKQIDMSSEAITRRLRQASQLRDLSLSLMKAKKAHDEKLRTAENGTQDQGQNTAEPPQESNK